MSGIRIRRTVILARVETLVPGSLAYGNTATPTASTLTGSDAVQVSNVKLTPLSAEYVSRDHVRSFMGGSQKIMTSPHVKLEFEVDLAGAGALGTVPAWGPLLRMCGAGQSVVASTSVTYTFLDEDHEYGSIWVYHDRKLHKLRGARGNVQFRLDPNSIPRAVFSFTGLYTRPTDIALGSLPTPTYTTWQVPLAANADNTSATYASVNLNAVSLNVDIGNDVRYANRINEECVRIVDRQAKGKASFEATYTDAKDWFAHMENQTAANFVLDQKASAVEKIRIESESMALSNLSEEDVDGVLYYACDLDFQPASGNDDLILKVIAQ
jgi:hypothetical protein